MSATLHRNTPTLRVIDSRGLPVRQVAYLRIVERDEPQARITRQQHDATGRVIAQTDPRLSVSNLTNVYSLSGTVLLSKSVDAGWYLSLAGEAGQTLDSWDPRGSHWQTDYNYQLRPMAIHLQAAAQDLQTVERFSYGDASAEMAMHNQCGQLIRHDDPAGTLLVDDFSLLAAPRGQTRRLRSDPQQTHWPAELPARDDLLEPGAGHTTRWHYSPAGEILKQIDAKGHEQRFSFDLAAGLNALYLRLKDAPEEQKVLLNVHYNAFGRIESQTAGNGVSSNAIFDPIDGRLSRMTASRSGRSPLQDLHYFYDPVGNVLRIEDPPHQTRYFANQRVEAVNTYTYDSLYQLTHATGREALGANIQPGLPDPTPNPGDTSQLLNYIQRYEYDKGGNLTLLRHEGSHPSQPHTRIMKIAPHSNRGLPWKAGDAPPDFEKNFDPKGNLQALQSGQALEWNARNQLQRVALVSRENADDDDEHYFYDGSDQRIRKLHRSQAKTITHHREVRYLPGLEIRMLDDTEELHVILLQAGRCNVRCLHWVKRGSKEIENGQLRYCLDDHLGSSTMELDDKADLISHEGYYPYGGTAWRAARSAVEADYKTVRYSGKERDASGLYYYGFRYYAPWLQRWICPDPASATDGLNLYGFCGNNPTSRRDPDGRMWQEPDDMLMDRALDQFLDNEQSLRVSYALPPIVPRLSEQGLPNFSQGNDSTAELHPGSPARPDSPGSPTVEQNNLLGMLEMAEPQFRYNWNSLNVLVRNKFGGKVYRADRREPEEILRDGFHPSDEFGPVPKMIPGEVLIVAETLKGALFYGQDNSSYHYYEIDATEVRGVSLLENLVLNKERMLEHLGGASSYSHYSPSDLTGEANKMYEAHLNYDELQGRNRPIVPIRYLGDRQAAEEHLRTSMNR